ncbi:MAG: aminotransferase class V-fold PLP-dependent enzyme [Candidatus Heimdallarchaeota archaeon]|nr:aminotransferase class V-fold PLP-dependent enzyme [Candidatus Heimdallarchaeota archaeon]
MTFSVEKVRMDFPILEKKRNGKPIIYSDSACMALKPKQVVDTLVGYYTEYTACAGRSPHMFSRETTKRCDEARVKVAKFINAKDPSEVVWTRNTTESLNLGCGILKLDGTETILTTSESHNSNIVKWMFLENAGKIKLQVLETPIDGPCATECIEEAVQQCKPGKFLVSLAHVSNVTAAKKDVKTIAKIIHEREGYFLLDAAQSFPHMPIDVQDLGIDLMGVSMHKACGPTGMGILYGRYDLLEKINPLILGGETVSDVHISDKNTKKNKITMLPPPSKFEAGLQNYAGIIASGATVDYLSVLGMENIHNHEQKLSETMLKGLSELGDKVSVLGPDDPTQRAALAAIDLKEINSHEVAILLDDMANIMLRSGYHCTHAFHHQLELDQGTLRPSWYLYNTIEEVKTFNETLAKIIDIFS